MDKTRANHSTQESGVALVMALILTVAMLLLIAGLSYLFVSGYRANTINRSFSTVYDAANGGVDYTTGIIIDHLKGQTPASLGTVTVDPTTTSLSSIVTGCVGGTATITGKTADGSYTIATTVECLGSLPIPGYGGVLRFPPPPNAAAGGTGTMVTKYIIYSVKSEAKESSNPQNIGQTEVVFRTTQ